MATRVKPLARRTPRVAALAAIPGTPRVTAVPAVVIETTDGPITLRQKIARYYKGLIALIGTILTLATAPEIGPLQHLLPAEHQHYLTIGIGAATVVLTFLKENQHWFEDQPAANAAPGDA